MSYEEKFEIVKKSLIKYCKECIKENWNQMFDMWLMCEADMVFGYGYQNRFKDEFSEYMDSKVEEILWFAGQNLLCGIRAFKEYSKGINLKNILNFTEKFIIEQLDEFDNWTGGAISMENTNNEEESDMALSQENTNNEEETGNPT